MRVSLSVFVFTVTIALFFIACGAPNLPNPNPEPMLTVVIKPANISEPWLIEWDGDSRMAISNQLSRGIALVRYQDMRLELMPDCLVEGSYQGGSSASRPVQEESIESESDIEAKLGLKVVAAKGKFEKDERWSLNYTVADILETDIQSISRNDLPANCAAATHFVSRAYLGAYVLDTGATRKLEGKLGVVSIPMIDASTGGSTGGQVNLFVSDGDYEQCKKMSTPKSDAACSGLLKIGLREIGE